MPPTSTREFRLRPADIFYRFYIWARRGLRGFILRHPALDLLIGNALAQVDLAFRKTGIMNVALDRGFLEHNGFKLYFGKEDADLAAFIVTNNDYEEETRELIEKTLKRGDVFVDLGANIGFYTLLAARLVGPQGKVFAFEPTPNTKGFLEKNVTENHFTGIVTVEGRAVSGERGKARFSITELSECNAISDKVEGESIEVETISLDEYFLENGTSKIDLIKMDIEGQEFPAIRGMRKISELNPGMKIIFEYHKANIQEQKLTGLEIFQLLQEYGFRRFTVLFREPFEIEVPRDMDVLERAASRANVNILAERITEPR